MPLHSSLSKCETLFQKEKNLLAFTQCCLLFWSPKPPPLPHPSFLSFPHPLAPSFPHLLPFSYLSLSLGVLSEEQIRLKKLKRQEEEQAHATSLPPRASSPPQILPQLSPEQLGMIEKLVAAQQQCNRRSFSDRLRVTVLDTPGERRLRPDHQWAS